MPICLPPARLPWNDKLCPICALHNHFGTNRGWRLRKSEIRAVLPSWASIGSGQSFPGPESPLKLGACFGPKWRRLLPTPGGQTWPENIFVAISSPIWPFCSQFYGKVIRWPTWPFFGIWRRSIGFLLFVEFLLLFFCWILSLEFKPRFPSLQIGVLAVCVFTCITFFPLRIGGRITVGKLPFFYDFFQKRLHFCFNSNSSEWKSIKTILISFNGIFTRSFEWFNDFLKLLKFGELMAKKTAFYGQIMWP